MAESKKKPSENTEKKEKKLSLIDSIYMKYMRSVVRALGSSDFYKYFISVIANSENEIQFSNRRMEKLIDESWVEAIEAALPGLQNIIMQPRNTIKEDELIVNVGLARKSDSATVRHLAQHGSRMIDDFDEDKGEVTPNTLMQRYREDSTVIYENRLTITVLEQAYHFVKIRYEALINTMSDEYGAKLKLTSDVLTSTEMLHTDLFLHIKERDDVLDTDDKHRQILDRIARLDRILSGFMASPFAQNLIKASRVRGAIVKTNVLKKNPNYKAVVKLYEFLQHYQDIGYAIKITEQNPEINDAFQMDIFHSILFNYIVLKNYLEDESDRVVPTKEKSIEERTLKPKFIKEIIEELTEDYDLPDVEIRKVLIEELTKAQLMEEEAAERRRLVEEQEKRKQEEEERLRKEKEAEEERQRIEREKEEERIRKEQEEEQRRRDVERLERDIEDRRRGKFFKEELDYFFENLDKNLKLREEEATQLRLQAEKQEFADAVKLLEEQEQRKKEEAERARRRQEEIREQIRRERLLAEEREKAEALAKQAEEAARIERERLAKEAEQKAKEAEREAKDRALVRPYTNELTAFQKMLENRIAERRNYEREWSRALQESKAQISDGLPERITAGTSKTKKRR